LEWFGLWRVVLSIDPIFSIKRALVEILGSVGCDFAGLESFVNFASAAMGIAIPRGLSFDSTSFSYIRVTPKFARAFRTGYDFANRSHLPPAPGNHEAARL